MKLLVICCFLSILVTGAIRFPSLSWLYSSSILHRPPPRADEIDEYGKIPQLERVKKAVKQASTILILRSSNDTVVGIVDRSYEKSLKLPVGRTPLTTLIDPHTHVLMTGIASDCHFIFQKLQEIVIQYKFKFNTEPSLAFLAKSVGKILQEHFEDNPRYLACHLFLFQTKGVKNTTSGIYEVTPSGSVYEVYGGVAGKESDRYKSIFEGHFHEDMNTTETETLIRNTCDDQCNTHDKTNKEDKDKKEEDEEDSDEEKELKDLRIIVYPNVVTVASQQPSN